MKIAILKLAIVACFILCLQSLIYFWHNNIPVAREQQCVTLHYALMNRDVIILTNDIVNGESKVFYIEEKIIDDITFSALRELNATGVDCL